MESPAFKCTAFSKAPAAADPFGSIVIEQENKKSKPIARKIEITLFIHNIFLNIVNEMTDWNHQFDGYRIMGGNQLSPRSSAGHRFLIVTIIIPATPVFPQ